MSKKQCLNGWTDILYVECLLCSHNETCEPFMLRRLAIYKSHAKAYGFDVPDDVTTLDQFKELYEIDFRDGGTHGVTRLSDGLYQGEEWHKQNHVLDKDGYYHRIGGKK
jgi:hypothetical protein